MIAGAALCALATVALLPGVLTGVWIAERARSRHLALTWAVLACVPALALVVLVAPGMAARVTAAAPVSALWVARACLVLWGAATPVAWVFWQLRKDRQDRLRGGTTGRGVQRRLGPVDMLRRRAAQRRGRDRSGNGDELLLGCDDRGFPVRVPVLRAHVTIVGGSDTGKTNTAAVILEGHVARGFGMIVLDGKGGRDLPRVATELARRHGRRVAVWSVQAFGDIELDAARHAWNPVGEGDATEIKDRIASSEEQTEPYYAAIASRGLLDAASALLAIDGRVWLDSLADILEDPAALAQAVEAAGMAGAPQEAAWLASLNDRERSALLGMATRLRTMVRSEGGSCLVSTGRPEISLYRALREGWLVVFSLPQGTYPELVPHVARYALSAVNAACGRLEREGHPARALLLVDELSAFRGDELATTYERARSAGVRVIAATQSLSNFRTTGGEKLLHATLDNSELIVVHRQAVPDATELLGRLAGTDEAWAYSQHIRPDRTGPLSELLALDGGRGHGRTLAERFRAHPNTIRELRRGEAIVIARRPTHRVALVRVTPSLTTRTPSSADQLPARVSVPDRG
jgi:conjugal transfer pilus assembly protein TraD